MLMRDKRMLNQFSELLNEQGEYSDLGYSESQVDEMITYGRELFPNKSFCVVSRWCWADVDADPGLAAEFEQAGIQPCFIYATHIVRDEAKRWPEDTPVRTGYLVSFHKECIFSSRKTNYILHGRGVRLRVIPSVFGSFSID